jgi:bHLH-MYC and R2R3-MYB transcription factors N-terminal
MMPVEQEVTDIEWFFLVSISHNFINGFSFPGQAMFSGNPIWVAGGQGLAIPPTSGSGKPTCSASRPWCVYQSETMY